MDFITLKDKIICCQLPNDPTLGRFFSYQRLTAELGELGELGKLGETNPRRKRR